MAERIDSLYAIPFSRRNYALYILPGCSRVVYFLSQLYGYRRNENSFTRKPFSEERLDIFTVNHDAFLFMKSLHCTEILPFVAKEFWRRFYHYGRRAIKNGFLLPSREAGLLSFCKDIMAYYPPRHPGIYLLAKLFLSSYTRRYSRYLMKKL